MSKDWIKWAISKKGALHKELWVPAWEKIPGSQIKGAINSSNPLLRKRAILANTLSKFK